jgi:glutaredoxin 3
MSPKSIRLFIKPGCPWCDEAIEWLDERGIQYEVLDVIRDAEARREMHELTGQTRAPSMDADGHILADFGAEELHDWWKKMGFDLPGKSSV